MIRWIGALLLMAGAAGLGLGAAAQLRTRVASLRSLVGALGQLERELTFRLTPMPELMERLARQSQGPAAYLCVRRSAKSARPAKLSSGSA